MASSQDILQQIRDTLLDIRFRSDEIITLSSDPSREADLSRWIEEFYAADFVSQLNSVMEQANDMGWSENCSTKGTDIVTVVPNALRCNEVYNCPKGNAFLDARGECCGPWNNIDMDGNCY